MRIKDHNKLHIVTFAINSIPCFTLVLSFHQLVCFGVLCLLAALTTVVLTYLTVFSVLK